MMGTATETMISLRKVLQKSQEPESRKVACCVDDLMLPRSRSHCSSLGQLTSLPNNPRLGGNTSCLANFSVYSVWEGETIILQC